MERETRVRFDPDARTPLQARLLAELHAFETAESLVPPQGPDLRPLAAELDTFLDAAARTSSRLRMFFTGPRKKQDARDALGRLAALMLSQSVTSAQQRLHAAQTAAKPDAPWLWNDYLARPVVYNGLLIEVAGLTPTRTQARGSCHPMSHSGYTNMSWTCRS